MAYSVEIRPPGAGPYSLLRLFDDYMDAHSEGMSQSTGSFVAGFQVRLVSPELAAHHFEMRTRYQALQPPPVGESKPVSTDVLFAHYRRNLVRRGSL
ncbi:hypothetical protein [Derxia gummosa]|uniref:Uncharacterized protein n=1 Tax=Derxia gummosa DSM 723 TaxID=1121388 RepID=A0A8B6X360_9BURK|nr:hypothetical protein [Derxia gummosa]